ncbi:hypothetical protein [Amycolatopsis sp. NPDC003731]
MTTVSTPNPSASLPLEDLLAKLRERRWTLHVFGPPDAPDLYASSVYWGGYTDVLLIRSEKSATAYRVPMLPGVDFLAPREVVWQYHSAPTWTVRAVLALPAPGLHGAPSKPERPNVLCKVPQELRQRRTTRRSGLNQPPDWSWF